MRPIKIGFLAFSAFAVTAAIAGPGCTETVVDPVEEDSGLAADVGTGNDAVAPKDSGKDSATVQDSGKDSTPTFNDSGTDASRDGSADASDSSVADGGSSPATGTACTTVGFIYPKKCGFCGTSEAACEADMKVGVYGACSGEVVDGCMPGTTRSSACGLCGTKSEICQNNCQWASGTCMGEPVGACAPGNVKYTTAGCTTANTFRKQTCGTTCQYGAPEPPPCKPKDTGVAIATTVGGTVTFSGELSKLTDQIPRQGSGTCPTTPSTTSTSYAYVEVKNTTAQAAKVEIWFDAPAGGTDIDTVVTTYPGNVIPTTPAARNACTNTVNDFCSTLPCTGSWSGLVGTAAVSIPAGGSILVYHAAYFSDDTGPFDMFVKTTSLL